MHALLAPRSRRGVAIRALAALALLAAGVLLAAGLPATHASGDDGFSTDRAAVVGPLNCTDDCTVFGHSSILRSDRRVAFTISVIGLQRASIYGVWAFAFNNPDACSNSPCSSADLQDPKTEPTLFQATSVLSESSGSAIFGGEILRNSQGGRIVFGAGLTNPLGAELHFVLRNHGQPLPGHIHEQMRDYLGGCTPDISLCVNEAAAIHQ